MPEKIIPSECDVIVIGAGIAGLTATALLSKAGLKAVLLEEQSRPGGYLMGFRRKGYFFDSSIQWLNQCNKNGVVHRIFKYIGQDAPESKHMKRIRRYKSNTFDYLLTSNPFEFCEQLIRDFPDEKDGIIKFFEDCRKFGKHFNVVNDRMRSIDTMSIPEKAVFGLKMLWWVIPIWKYLRMSAVDGLSLYFKNEDIKKIFPSEEKFMSVIMPICWAFSGDFQSPPEGGAAVYVDWLCNKIKKTSSGIFLKSPVEKVIVENKTAKGVTLADGQTIRSKYIIAACDVESLYERMLPAGAVPGNLIDKLKDADLYYSSVTLFIGLDCDSSKIGLYEELLCITAENITREEQSGRDPHKIPIMLHVPTISDRTLAPEGKSTLVIHCAAYLDYEDYWRTGKNFSRGEAYKKFKKEFADIMIDRIEKTMNINIRKHINVMEISTPVSYWRYTKNRNGSIMGASPTDKNIKNKLAHNITPVKNLYLAGHWAEYGGGMPVAVKSASNVSLLILKRENRQEFEKIKNAMDGN
jgi:prolycopene isomerase